MKKKTLRNLKNSTIFGKRISTIVLAITLTATLGFALLTTFVTVTGQATVQQSVVLVECHTSVFDGGAGPDTCDEDSETSASWTSSASGGDTRAVGLNLENRGAVSAPLDLDLSGTVPTDAVWGTDVTAELFDDYDESTESCTGSSLGTFSSASSSVSAGSLSGDSTSWYCIELVWDIAAFPGDYEFDVDVSPEP